MPITLLVADDHEVVRSGLASMLKGSNIKIVAEAETGKQAYDQTVKHKPDVVLLDIRLSDDDGLETLEKIHKKLPETPVVMISAYDNPTYVARASVMGAKDYVVKGCTRQELVAAIERAAAGEELDDSSLLKQVSVAMGRQRPKGEENSPLTNREHQTLRHIALGLSNKEIARSLGISVETVKEHVQNLMRKLDVSDRTEAAVWAVRRGLV
jgi:DNA-binding NarL/FixJ family response regulator